MSGDYVHDTSHVPESGRFELETTLKMDAERSDIHRMVLEMGVDRRMPG